MQDFYQRLAANVALTEAALDALLPQDGSNPMIAPMRHGVLNGGKRLRAFLALESAALFEVDLRNATCAAAAIECMHAYSLIHDDLPCMDDDDLRRGQPTVHVQWDEATAVLAGDALQTLAFEILANPATSENAAIRIALIQGLSGAAGAQGMVLGQAQDIAAETAELPLTLAQIKTLQANKTGALIEWSAHAGAVLAGQVSPELRSYAKALGLAFQIHDDVLDVTGDSEVTGKRLQKDAEAGKATFVSLLGLDSARNKANSLVDEACDALTAFGPNAEPLRQVARFVVDRKL